MRIKIPAAFFVSLYYFCFSSHFQIGRADGKDFEHHFLEKNNLIVGEAQSAFKLFEAPAVGSKLSY